MANKTQFINLDENTRLRVEEKFQYKKNIAKEKEKELFSIFSETLTQDEELALKYLYAYMPLNDLADYNGELFLKHVRDALHIQSVVPWGEKVPSSIFLHFILPYRVNNENIEDYRELLFKEIFPRVQNMTMEQAILETNHWCHEKATYVGNDPRTVSPLTLMRTTLGRCGEQSTLAVAALRSIGIPARQVYTPLWAHSDSNHAWVEAWADGKWYFFGACEPEPRLNQGWFEKPARRAMLVHTRLAANYEGPEEVTLAHPWYSELNLTSLYADTKKITVKITDSNGKPTKAKVHFQLYNFGGLRNILSMDTDEQGEVRLTTGLGDLYISATGPSGWGFGKCDVAKSDGITITLSKEIPVDFETEFQMVPPSDRSEDHSSAISEEEKTLHSQRVKEGAQIRANYEATFLTEKDARLLANECHLPEERVWEVLKKARGNSHEIASYLREYSKSYGIWSLQLLEVLNDKDLADTFIPTLVDHLTYAMKIKDALKLEDDFFAKYVLRPRVHYEMLTPYRSYFLNEIGEININQFINNPALIVDMLNEEFEVIPDINYYRGSATPKGSFKLKKGDALSRDILFVALARSIGIPARLNRSDLQPQYFHNGEWKNALFTVPTNEAKTEQTEKLGTVIWENKANEEINYFSNFSIARFNNGLYQTLFYKFTKKEKQRLELAEGHYRLTTSSRLTDGTALVRFKYFEVKSGEEITIPIIFPKAESKVPVLGDANLAFSIQSVDGKLLSAAEQLGTNGTAFVWIEPDREPSKHLLRELREMKDVWEQLNVKINCFINEEKWMIAEPLFSDEQLPKNMLFIKESQNFDGLDSFEKHLNNEKGQRRELPIVYVLDQKEQIRHISEGYKLGISKEIADIFNQLVK